MFERCKRVGSGGSPVGSMALLLLCLLTMGCRIGPTFHHPAVPMALAYKELGSAWNAAEPKENIPRGKWWEIFQDPQLNALEERIDVGNQNTKVGLCDDAGIRISWTPEAPHTM